jgi:hypothetical protein
MDCAADSESCKNAGMGRGWEKGFGIGALRPADAHSHLCAEPLNGLFHAIDSIFGSPDELAY